MENEEKPVVEQKPMPVMDVVPPPSVKKVSDVVEAPLETDDESEMRQERADESDEHVAVEAKAPNKQPEPAPAVPKAPKPEPTVPVAPIVIAVVFFIVLSGLAFYAYTKTN